MILPNEIMFRLEMLIFRERGQTPKAMEEYRRRFGREYKITELERLLQVWVPPMIMGASALVAVWGAFKLFYPSDSLIVSTPSPTEISAPTIPPQIQPALPPIEPSVKIPDAIVKPTVTVVMPVPLKPDTLTVPLVKNLVCVQPRSLDQQRKLNLQMQDRLISILDQKGWGAKRNFSDECDARLEFSIFYVWPNDYALQPPPTKVEFHPTFTLRGGTGLSLANILIESMSLNAGEKRDDPIVIDRAIILVATQIEEQIPLVPHQ